MPRYPLSKEIYQQRFNDEAEAFVAAYTRANLDEIVPSCPEWNVAQLGAHLGSIYHRVAALIHTCSLEPLDPKDFPAPTDPREVLEYARDGARKLSVEFVGLDPTAPIWTYAGILPALFWIRRMTHETMVHAFDLDAILPPVHRPDASALADGIDEFLSAQLARKLALQHVVGLSGRMALTIADSDDRWVIGLFPDHLEILPGGSDTDAELTGSAYDLLMFLWRRALSPALVRTGDLDLFTTYFQDV